jgi:hypothetical protein
MLGKNCQFFKITHPPQTRKKKKKTPNPACEGRVVCIFAKLIFINIFKKKFEFQ